MFAAFRGAPVRPPSKYSPGTVATQVLLLFTTTTAVLFNRPFGSRTDPISLLILLLFFLFLLGRPLQNSPRLHRFKLDQDEIWQDCSSSKYTSIVGVGFWYDVMHSCFQDGGYDVCQRLQQCSSKRLLLASSPIACDIIGSPYALRFLNHSIFVLVLELQVRSYLWRIAGARVSTGQMSNLPVTRPIVP